MGNHNWILEKLPYTQPFCFVDELEKVTDDGITGHFKFEADSFFYKGHFKDHPVTPGVILTECCAQIGLVCLGIHLLAKENKALAQENIKIAMSSNEMQYYLPVFPDEKVRVESIKTYFRFNKLKCEVKMYNADDKLVCAGVVAGMFKIDA